MIIRGMFDPYSAPIADVDRAIAGSADTYELEIPNQSYNALGFLECPVAIRNAWIDAPTSPPADTNSPLAHSGDFAGAMKRAGAQHGPSSGRQGLMNDG